MPNPPKNDKDRLDILLEKVIKKEAYLNAENQALWVSLLEPLCDAHGPADWREENAYV